MGMPVRCVKRPPEPYSKSVMDPTKWFHKGDEYTATFVAEVDPIGDGFYPVEGYRFSNADFAFFFEPIDPTKRGTKE